MFDDLDPRLSLFCDVICPCKKICGGCQMCVPRSIDPRQVPYKISTQICIRSAFFLRQTQLISIAYFPYKQGNDQLHITMCTPKKIGQLKFIAIRKMQWEYGKLKLKTCLFKKGFETSLESVIQFIGHSSPGTAFHNLIIFELLKNYSLFNRKKTFSLCHRQDSNSLNVFSERHLGIWVWFHKERKKWVFLELFISYDLDKTLMAYIFGLK